MATETVTVTCNTSTYTALNSGGTNVTAFVRKGQIVRFHVGAEAPDAATEAAILVEGASRDQGYPMNAFVAQGLGTGEEVYALLVVGNQLDLIVVRS